jgi:hypothetical protein
VRDKTLPKHEAGTALHTVEGTFPGG